MTGEKDMLSMIVMHTAINFTILMAMIILAYMKGKSKDEVLKPSIVDPSAYQRNTPKNKVK